jgi:SOS-response transcriptional repressor LexA
MEQLADRTWAAGVTDDLGVGAHRSVSCVTHDGTSTIFRALRTTGVRQNRAMGTKPDPDQLKLEQASRLRAAREHVGCKDATEGAAYLSRALRVPVSQHTYIQHENGWRGIKRAVDDYAEGYGVPPEWLLYGRNPPEWYGAAPVGPSAPFLIRRAPPGFVPVVGYVAANAEGNVLFADAHESWDLAEMPGAGPGSAAFEVRGGSMPGIADEGSLIFIEAQHREPQPGMNGHIVVCGLETGEVLVKRLIRNGKRWDLSSIVGEPIRDARFRWIAEVTDVAMPAKAARIIRRGGLVAA